MLLSDRMRAVAGLAAPCRCIADIGCDHGYVAMELIRSRTCQHVIAMDINRGPLERAKHNIKEYDMQDYIETRLSDGTNALEKGEADGIICAGMGGKLIISILERGHELVVEMKQLILQPQSEIGEVREYLRESGFLIDKEDIICECDKYYPMMRALPGSFGKQEKQIAGYLEKKLKKTGLYNLHILGEGSGTPNPPDISEVSKVQARKLTRIHDIYGPYLLQKSHPVLRQYLLCQKEILENIRENLMNQKNPTARQQRRIDEIEMELSDIVFCLYNYFYP